MGYGVLYDTAHLDLLPRRADLTLVLVVASITPTLRDELGRMGWALTPLGGGYGRIDGAVYTTFVVITDEVTEAERDGYLRLFSHRPEERGEAARWLGQWMKETRMKQPDVEDLPSFYELFKKTIDAMPLEELLAGHSPEEVLGAFAPEQRMAGLAPEQRVAGLAPEQRVAGLAPEQRVAGLAPEQRVAGLSTEQQILALPLEALRALSQEYLRSLSTEAQAQIQKRLRDSVH